MSPRRKRPTTPPKGIDRVIGVLSRVRPGEGVPVVILLIDLFLILTSYYLLKVVREPLVLLDGSAEIKSYAAAGQAVLLMALVPLYGWFSTKVNRMTLVNTVTAVFALSFVLFWGLYQQGIAVGVPFYLWLGIFSMLVIAQFWSLANELFSPAQGKRLFPIIAIGGTLGAIAGSFVAKQLIAWIGVGNIMLVAAWLLGICIALTIFGAARARDVLRDTDEAEATDEDEPLGKEGGFRLIAKVRYLRLIAIMVVVYNIVNTTGEYILGSVVTERATIEAAGDRAVAERLIGEFYGGFFTWVNIVAAVLQAFVVARVVKYVGIRAALLVLPMIALGGYAMIAVVPVLMAIKVAKIIENGTDYSLHNTVRQMLWLPTTNEAKYKAKSAVDAFFVRFGDVLAAGVVWGGSALALTPRMFAAVNVVAVGVWIAIALLVGREHDRQPRAVTSDDGSRKSPRVVRGKYAGSPA